MYFYTLLKHYYRRYFMWPFGYSVPRRQGAAVPALSAGRAINRMAIITINRIAIITINRIATTTINRMPRRKAQPCPHFLPGELPYTVLRAT